MKEFVSTLGNTPALLIAVVIAFTVIVLLFSAIFYSAFKKGHPISFWPPRIEPLPPIQPKTNGKKLTKEEQPSNENFIINRSTFILDFSNWANIENSKVTVERTDVIEKTTSKSSCYTHPFYTTGDEITCTPLQQPIKPEFESRDAPEEQNMKAYDYVLDLSNQPKGYIATITNLFTFYNGFKNTEKEWWAASIKYPTKKVVVFFVFHNSKPCKSVEVKLREGHSNSMLLSENKALLSQNGTYLSWVGDNIPSGSRIYFNFTW